MISKLCGFLRRVLCVELHHDFVDFLRVDVNAVVPLHVFRKVDGVGQCPMQALAFFVFPTVDLAQQERGQVECVLIGKVRGANAQSSFLI